MTDSEIAQTSRAAIRAHPIHPMLIAFPVALLSLAPVTDIVYFATGQAFWARVSFYFLLAGLVSAVVAAVFGLWDFFGIPKVRSHRAAWVHLFSNAGAMFLVVLNLFVRSSAPLDVGGLGLLLSLAAAACLAVGGWYGGELSYRHRIGVMRNPAAE